MLLFFYATDKLHIYYEKKVVNGDKATFRALSCSFDYAEDKLHEFYRDEIVRSKP